MAKIFKLTERLIGTAIMVVFFLTCFNSNAQVGIGTNDPAVGLMLEVKDDMGTNGVLLPTASIDNLKTVSPLPTGTTTGTLVYNTNQNTGVGYYYWDGSAWTRSTSYIGQMAKFANPAEDASSPNLSNSTTTSIQVELVDAANVEFNDNPGLYQPVGKTGVRIMQTGRYHITAALSFIATSNGSSNRAEIDGRLYLGNTLYGPLFRSSEMNPTPGNPDFGSLGFTQTVEVTAGQIITVRAGRAFAGNIGVVKLRSTGTSTLFIEKLL